MSTDSFQALVFICFIGNAVAMFGYFWLVCRDIEWAGKHTDDHLSNIDARLRELSQRLAPIDKKVELGHTSSNVGDINEFIRTERAREEKGNSC